MKSLLKDLIGPVLLGILGLAAIALMLWALAAITAHGAHVGWNYSR